MAANETDKPPPKGARKAAQKPLGKTARKDAAAPKPATAPPVRGAATAKSATADAERPAVARTPDPVPRSEAKPGAPAPSLMELLQTRTFADYEAMSRNMFEASLRAQKIAADTFTRQSPVDAALNASPDPFGVGPALAEVWADIAADPGKLLEAQTELWRGYASIWHESLRRFISGGDSSDNQPVRDRRFADPEWSQNAAYDMLRRLYLFNTEWLISLVSSAKDADESARRKALFFMRQAADAFSPSNFALTNPAVMRAALTSRGENFVKGLDALKEDLERGKGRLALRQTDMNKFKVGVNVATAPGKVIFRNEIIELLQFEASTDKVRKTPLLIFPPWINKYYILDLREENSMIRWLTAQGNTVFVASWVNPDARLAEKTFEDYMEDGIFAALDAVAKATGERRVNAVGYCIGGTLLGATLAYMAARGDERIASATFFAAQTDFKLAGDLLVFTDDTSLRYIEKLIDEGGGLLDAQVMAETFNSLRSADLYWSYIVNNYLLGETPKAFDLLFWNADQTRMPRALHLFYLKRMYRDNALSLGQLEVKGVRLDLSNVTIPVYMQASRDDHIAPAASVFRSAKRFGGPVRLVVAGSGHIAGVINAPAARKYQHWTNDRLGDTLDQWFAGAKEQPGSWWPDWDDWLAARSGPLVKARKPGDGDLPVLGAAPGTYVLIRSDEA